MSDSDSDRSDRATGTGAANNGENGERRSGEFNNGVDFFVVAIGNSSKDSKLSNDCEHL